MIIKNLTFVVSHSLENEFIEVIFKATDNLHPWVDEIKVFRLMEVVDPETYNYALQLSFNSQKQLDEFNSTYLISLIDSIQNEIKEPVLYFESHLKKVF